MAATAPASRPAAKVLLLLAVLAGAFSAEVSPGAADGGGKDGAPNPRTLHPLLEEFLRSRLQAGRSPFLIHAPDGRILARVRTHQPDILRREAPAMGIAVRAVVGGIASVAAPAAALPALSRLPGVISVKPARAYRPMLDVSTPDVGADAEAAAYGGTGRGVIVAVIDTGIDFRHLDFRNPDGSSRVLAAWDQTDAAGGGAGCRAGITMGRCWSKADLDADLTGGPAAGLEDGFGHGTHVAGIAAGNGLATANGVPPGTYAGVAPEADLLVVKVFTTTGAFEGDLTAAYAWIEQEAADADEPFVINMSLGSDLGAHDATDPDEISLDALLAPGNGGRAAAIASGNSRGDAIHVEGTVAAGGTNDHPFQIPSYTPLSGAGNDAIYMDLWYEGGDDLTVGVLDPNGVLLASAARGTATGTVCTASGAVTIDATNTPDPDNLDSEVFIVLSDDGACSPVTAPPGGRTMKVRVTGVAAPLGGRYHIWSESLIGSSGSHIRFNPASESTLVGVPATSRHATSVGGYVTRSCWPNADPNSSGTTCFGISAAIGNAASYSSNGLTRDGRLKPEVAAPGEFVAAALTSLLPTMPLVRRTPDGFHWTLRGTSMAAPHAAGALAGLLQFNPGLDAAQARDLLSASARADAFTGSVPNSIFGGGKLDVLAGSESLLKLVTDLTADVTGALSWAPEPHSVTYNLYRGDLPLSAPPSYGTCLVSGLGVPAYDDPAGVPPGGGFFYLATGVRDGIEGSLGFDAAGEMRPNVSPCP